MHYNRQRCKRTTTSPEDDDTARFALDAVFVYQRTLRHRHTAGAALRVGLKPFLQAV